jgi:SfnB family sulfur acquisition oxidoreductase
MKSLNNGHIQQIKNDQEAINAAYQVADFALENRNQRDQAHILPFAEIAYFSQRGLGGIRIPQQYGGAFVSNKTLAHVFRILNKADSSVGQIPQNQIALLNVIDLIATEPQKHFIFNEILQGKRLANGGPERYSKDIRTLNTTLSYQNGQYFLDGEKFYSTGSSFADWLAIKAIHPEGHVVLIIVEKNSNGIEVIDNWDGFGQRTTSSGTVKLKHVLVNPFLILDERKLGDFPHYRGAYSQLLQTAIDVGIAEAAFAETLASIHKARPIQDSGLNKASKEPYILQEVGRLNILLDAAILLLDEAAEYLDELDLLKAITEQQAAKASILVAEAKVYANDAALQISEKLIELGGSRSSLQQFNLDQYWRNARVHTLHDPIRWKLHALGDYYLNQKLPAKHAWI